MSTHDDPVKGEGKLLSKQVVLSRDEHGALPAVNSVWTHMGCDVEWNSDAKVWVEVLHGLASLPLPPPEIPE